MFTTSAENRADEISATPDMSPEQSAGDNANSLTSTELSQEEDGRFRDRHCSCIIHDSWTPFFRTSRWLRRPPLDDL